MSAFCSLDGQEIQCKKVPLIVEVQLKQGAQVDTGAVKEEIRRFLEGLVCLTYQDGSFDRAALAGHPVLEEHVESVKICDCDPSRHPLGTMVLFWSWELQIFVFQSLDRTWLHLQLSEEEPEDEDGVDGSGEAGEEGTSMYREWPLPSKELHGLWEALHYDEDSRAAAGDDGGSGGGCSGSGPDAARPPAVPAKGVHGRGVKQRLLKYSGSALLFSELGVSSHMVSWNRVVLLHGPPGTGKTSLCKALAQKLAIRFSGRYPAGCSLVEVNAHSLFSKYFSESGKLVGRLFARILELVEDGDSLVFVLLDEVESLTAARKAGGSEPTDSIRAVNALLTQLDQLRRFPNVMVLTTSNITGSIDGAFIDRADIKAYIGPPSLQARYKILRSAVLELGRAGVVVLPDPAHATLLGFTEIPSGSQAGMQQLPGRPGLPPSSASTGGVHPAFSDAAFPEASPGYAAANAAIATALLDIEAAAAGASAMDCDQAAASVVLSRALLAVAAACEGLSGRSLRKLPFLAHAAADWMPVPCPALQFLRAMQAAAAKEKQDRKDMAE